MSGQTTQQRELKQALKYIKTCPYKGTAIKIELEAQLNRGDGDSEYCYDCSGDGGWSCDYCSDGWQDCPNECYENELELRVYDNQDSDGTTECDCDDGRVRCENCDDGWNSCDSCGGSGREDNDWDDDACYDFMLNHVSEDAKNALIYSRFYYDGSVDSEYTFTLPVDKAHYAVEFIEAFKKLAGEIGNGMETSGAGMHIAVLNSPYGNYPRGNDMDDQKWRNFKQSMTPLLPALYFLGTSDSKSRGLHYRVPRIARDSKYSAVYGVEGHCMEFRVFETCYDNPTAVFDYLIVISKCLRFYRSTPIDTSMKIGTLGFKDGNGLQRFYYTTKHLKALDKGLKILKPDYKTIDTLKKERGFTITPKVLQEQRKEQRQQQLEEYGKYRERLAWTRRRLTYEARARYYRFLEDGLRPGMTEPEYVQQSISENLNLPTNQRQYLRWCQDNCPDNSVQYTITV